MRRLYRGQSHGQFCGCQSCYLKAVRQRENRQSTGGDWDDAPGMDTVREARAIERRYPRRGR